MTSSPYNTAPPNHWQFGMTVVPNVATQIYPRTTTLNRMWFANTTGSAVTLTVTDGSTEAGGSPCQIFPSVSIPTNSADYVDFNGVTANGGVSWFASATNAVQAWIQGAS